MNWVIREGKDFGVYLKSDDDDDQQLPALLFITYIYIWCTRIYLWESIIPKISPHTSLNNLLLLRESLVSSPK